MDRRGKKKVWTRDKNITSDSKQQMDKKIYIYIRHRRREERWTDVKGGGKSRLRGWRSAGPDMFSGRINLG